MIKNVPKTLRLSPELERAFLAAVIWGAVPPETIRAEELSGAGRITLRSTVDLLIGGHAPPLELPALLLVMTDVYGVNRDNAKAYLESIKASLPSAGGVEEVVRKLRQKHSLMAIINSAAGQLQKSEYDPDKLMEVLAGSAIAGSPTPLSDDLKDGLPQPPPRLALRSLPRFTERVGGGLIGLTVLGGEPAVGKSRLAFQICLEVGQEHDVLLYDLDNGKATLLDRASKIVGGNLDLLRQATSRIYVRDSIRTLDSDLVYLPPPALVVVDIFQALPTSLEFERQGLGHWIHRLAALRRKGYYVLVVSEIPRMFYGNTSGANPGVFKGSGEIEYTADLALHMKPNNSGAVLEVVKNRHSPFKGDVVTLKPDKGLLWKEIGEDWEALATKTPVPTEDF